MDCSSDDRHTQHVLDSDPASYRNYIAQVREGTLMLGRDIDITPKLKGWLEEVGFADVVEERCDVPYVCRDQKYTCCMS